MYAYDSQGYLPDTRSEEELTIAQDRAYQRLRAAHTAYVINSTEAWMDVQAIQLERRRRLLRTMGEPTTVRLGNPSMPLAGNRMKPAPTPTPIDEQRKGRMRLEGLDG